ncbi:MAG: TRAP transporter fused permease subunit [Pseudomonadota bacterium]
MIEDLPLPKKHSGAFSPTVVNTAIVAVSLAMILFHALIALFPIGDQIINQNTHLGFALVLVFLSRAADTAPGAFRKSAGAAALLALALIAYIAFNRERLAMTAGFPQPADVVVGTLLMVLVIGGTWISFGAAIPVLTLAALAYALGGHLLPGDAGHPALPFDYAVSSLSVGFQGIYGLVLNASVTTIFLLVVFGALFEVTGITALFMQIGVFLGRKIRGGSGQTAIFASTLTGMLNGVAAANVAITGFNTIPAMIAGGFKKTTAGAIEAVASTGGQLTPPVMGIAVFIMAGFLGIGYGQIMAMALVPAAAFYGIVVLGVIIIAGRERIPLGTVRENRRIIVAGLPVFLLPMGVVATLLMVHYSVGYAAMGGIGVLLVAASLQRATRPDLRALVSGLCKGAALGASFGVACACIGMLFKCLTLTGATTKIGFFIAAAAGGSQWAPLLLTMVLCLLLGTCLPTVAAYAIVAFTAVPILTDLGLSRIVAHFFAFYFGVMANVIPPISGPSLVASRISGAGYMATTLESLKLALPFFPLPFFLIRNPVFFLAPQPLLSAAAAVVALAMAMVSMVCWCQRYALAPNTRVEQAFLPMATFLSTGYGLSGRLLFFWGALFLFFVYLIGQWKRCRHIPGCEDEPILDLAGEDHVN